jgi:hypothetical protein
MNDYPFKDFLDFSLLKLNEVYPKGLPISNLVSKYKQETEIWIDDKQQKLFLELYEYKQIEKYGTTWNYKITAETKVIVDNYGNYSSYIRQLAISQIKKENEENELKKLQTENLTLQNTLLELQTKQQRRYILYSVISFTFGAIVTNGKDILRFLQSVFQE